MTEEPRSGAAGSGDSAPPPATYAAEPVVAPKRRGRISWVWLLPIGALVVGLWLAVHAWMQAGPEIVVEFSSAEGLEPGRTEVRYKEVVVGRVTHVALSEDRQKVLVSIALEKGVAELAVADTRFWVVKPRIGTGGVSGLSTLLNGAYVAVDAGVSEKREDHFIGLDTPPFPLHGEPGRSFVLWAEDLGSLDIGSPVYYRRSRVGRLVDYSLDTEHDRLKLRVFVEAPNDKLVTGQSRFWNASGIDFTFNAGGLTVDAQSVVSVLAGGIAFANNTPPGAASAPAAPAPEGSNFELFDNQKQALSPPDGPPMRIRMVFDQSMRGLAVGAPVDLLGVELGTVKSIALQHDEKTRRFTIEVIAEIFPLRLGSVRRAFDVTPRRSGAPDSDHLLLASLVDAGVRAQARTGNLLTGQLYIALDFIPKAKPAVLDASAEMPTMPTVPGTLSDVQPQLAEIVARIGKVKFDEIGESLQATLAHADKATLGLTQTLAAAREAIEQLTPEAQKALGGVRETLQSAQSTLEGLDRTLAQPDAPLQRNAQEALQELRRAARALRVLADYLQQHPEALLRGKPPPKPAEPEGSR